MRVRLQPVWEKEENRSKIVWAGIFGSVGRGRAHKDSDVDVVMVMTEGFKGEPIELEQGQPKQCTPWQSCIQLSSCSSQI